MKYLTCSNFNVDEIRFIPVPDTFDETREGFWKDSPDESHSFYLDTNFAIVSDDSIVDDDSYMRFDQDTSICRLAFKKDPELLNEFEEFVFGKVSI